MAMDLVVVRVMPRCFLWRTDRAATASRRQGACISRRLGGWGDVALPVITLQIFVLGIVIECFLDDLLAMVGRTYERNGGYLSIASHGRAARVLALRVLEVPA